MRKLVIASIGIIIGSLQGMAAEPLLVQARPSGSMDFSRQSFIGDGVQQLKKEEKQRCLAVQTNDVTEPAHTYGIIRHMNNIRTTGPAANDAEKYILVDSLIVTAMRITNFAHLTAFYLVEATNNLASRLTYLAISLLTHDQQRLEGKGEAEKATDKAVRLMALITNDARFTELNAQLRALSALKFFETQLVTYQAIFENQYSRVHRLIGGDGSVAIKKKKEHNKGPHTPSKPDICRQNIDYPLFYSTIVKNIENKRLEGKKGGDGARSVIEGFIKQISQYCGIYDKMDPYGIYNEMDAFDGLYSEDSVRHFCAVNSLFLDSAVDLVGIFALETPQAITLWRFLKKWIDREEDSEKKSLRGSRFPAKEPRLTTTVVQPRKPDALVKQPPTKAPTAVLSPAAGRAPTAIAHPLAPKRSDDERKISAETRETIIRGARALHNILNQIEYSAIAVDAALSQDEDTLNAALAEQRRLRREFADRYRILLTLNDDSGMLLTQRQIHTYLMMDENLAKTRAGFDEAIRMMPPHSS